MRLLWDCSLRKPSNAPQGQRIGGYGSSLGVLRPGPMGLRRNKKLKTWPGRLRVAGSRPRGPVGQVSRGLGARAPRAWGPARQGPGAFSPLYPPQITIFANLLVGAWRRRGCRLKRLLRRWGPGGKRSRDTPPYPPPPPPPWGCKGERKRVFTLSAFGNHPTRPPRSADIRIYIQIWS